PRVRSVAANEGRPPTTSGAAENRIEPPPPEAGNRVPQVSGSEAVGAAGEQNRLANRRKMEELHQQDSARKTGPTSMTRSNPAAMADPHLVADPRAELADEHACRILPGSRRSTPTSAWREGRGGGGGPRPAARRGWGWGRR